MKTDKNILIAFILNLFFSVIELFGGIITNSFSIISDSIHDFGDSISIGISYFLEKISKRKANNRYTFGYIRYSIIGSLITTLILIIGSIFIIIHSIERIFNPININYNGMIIFAIIGVIVNILATYFTKEGESLNQKSVNLHMLEDALGWIIVLIGAIIMKLTNIKIIDPILSIGLSIFILSHAIINLKRVFDIILEKVPNSISIETIKKELLNIENVLDIHHIHIWSLDGYKNYSTMHIVVNKQDEILKNQIKEKLKELNIFHSTIEFEYKNEECNEQENEV